MISVGLLVDNSVVVAENIHRLHREGMPRREAAIRGAGEIALAITMATLTTIIVFLPVSLVEGQAQFFLLRLSVPISVSLLASLGVAGVFVPLSVYLTLRNGASRRRDGAPGMHGRDRSGVRETVAGWYRGLQAVLERLYEASLGRLNRGYTRLLAFFLGHRLDLALLMITVFAISLAVASKTISFVDVQEEERSGFEIHVQLPDATTIEEAEQHFLACERAVEGLQTELGLEGWFLVHRATAGRIQGFFSNPRTVDISPREATERVLEELPKRPGVRYFTGEESQVDEARGAQVWVVSLFGEDAGQLEDTARHLEDLLTKVPGVLGVQSSGEPAPNELALVVDRQLTQQQQISPAVVAGVVGYALRGQALSRFRTGGNDIPVRIRFREDDRETLDQLKAFYVPAGDNGFVPLSSLTDVRFLTTERRIHRRDKQITRTITLELEEGHEDEARQRLAALQAQIDLPEGIRFGQGAAARRQADDMAALGLALTISIIFIYLLMGFLFESFVLPLSIIFTIPLAVIGVIWSHVIAGLDIDFLGGVGVVLLVGVVVNNGIVLIDYVNRLRSEGMSRPEALLTAARRRFRPIMMTALTTICGMIPVALSGSTSLGLSYSSFGLTLIGGLTTATLLTLLVVPVLYTAFDDTRELVMAALRQVLPRRHQPTGAGPASTDL
jgi:HAE1 family hydrophobic/amphiphilic exporter-1